jgi:hypothetical protein
MSDRVPQRDPTTGLWPELNAPDATAPLIATEHGALAPIAWEATAVPGLILTCRAELRTVQGGGVLPGLQLWSVTHLRSGTSVVHCAGDLENARAFARALGDSGLDWTLPDPAAAAPEEAQRMAFQLIARTRRYPVTLEFLLDGIGYDQPSADISRDVARKRRPALVP